MKRMPLRYNISSWEQLVNCMSNYSNSLSIKVKRLIHDTRLTGTIIEIFHTEFGPLFCYLVDGQGPLLASNDSLDYEMTSAQILQELERFGFFVTFNPKEQLPADQLEYLRTVSGLGFDKIRILGVREVSKDGSQVINPHVTVFNVEPNPGWLDNTYVASSFEYANALTQGTAVDLSNMSEVKRFRWDWLDYVANIQDILDDNIRCLLCQSTNTKE